MGAGKILRNVTRFGLSRRTYPCQRVRRPIERERKDRKEIRLGLRAHWGTESGSLGRWARSTGDFSTCYARHNESANRAVRAPRWTGFFFFDSPNSKGGGVLQLAEFAKFPPWALLAPLPAVAVSAGTNLQAFGPRRSAVLYDREGQVSGLRFTLLDVVPGSRCLVPLSLSTEGHFNRSHFSSDNLFA